MRAGPHMILRLIAIGMGGIAALMAAIELADSVTPPSGRVPATLEGDPLRAELMRCRTITPEELAADAACQAAWAENRRRFFGPDADTSGGDE
ncbi:MAG: putative entry exclusion protein TrbK-alt [Roseitalea sp.]|jgi:conjugative transfer region protein TrbK|nr:putative entry exclusion protein TrbK-alt [Roseitalea sp.]MBO6721014.1 putative entry exclusion protein TrbK-alt [Roseitalea sp.]MBO6742914.1 putative entry exclusion protein TrbK-alt [Roseitalea sp.]